MSHENQGQQSTQRRAVFISSEAALSMVAEAVHEASEISAEVAAQLKLLYNENGKFLDPDYRHLGSVIAPHIVSGGSGSAR